MDVCMSGASIARKPLPGLRRLLFGLAAGAAMLLPGHAQAAWPERDVTLLVHSGAGSSTDVMARALAKSIENVTGKNVVVIVKGKDAMAALQKANADGYTLSTQTRSFLADLASGRSPFPAEQFQWVARLIGETYAYGVQASSPYKTFADLVAVAKKNPNTISMSTFRTGSTHQIAAVVLNDRAGADFNIIPYNSGSDLVIAMLGGNADVAATNPSQLFEQIAADKARALVVLSAKRHERLPDVPTAKELGYDVEQYHWRGLIGKTGIPEATLNEIDAVMEKAIQDVTFQDYVRKGGLDMLAQGHNELTGEINKELPEIRGIMQRLGLVK